MDVQLAAIPLFDRDMAVGAYLFRYRKGNDLFSTSQATGVFDGASRSAALDTLNQVGLEAFTLGKPLFVPATFTQLLGDLGRQCTEAPENIIFLFEETPRWEEPYISKLIELLSMGYRIALGKVTAPEHHMMILNQCSYFFLSQKKERQEQSERDRLALRRAFPHLELVATHVDSMETFDRMKRIGYTLFESRFYSVPISEGMHEVAPIKANFIRLLNTVQDENFSFEDVTRIVQGDTALTISLLKMVNAPTRGPRFKIDTIQQAVAMLGEREVRKWVTTAVSQSLGSDKPNELTRISLVRAKFAEHLAPHFEMAHMVQSLFLMGLFSVLDIILEISMEEALKVVMVSDMIRAALVNQSGMYYPVLHMITCYERADWAEVSRLMLFHDIAEGDLSGAYIDALIWYRNLTALGDELEVGEPSGK